MKIYVAGPMRGYPEFNFPAFHEATRRLRAAGHEVFSPAERDINIGFNPAGMKGDHAELGPAGFNLREALTADLEWIGLHADMVVVLDGWEDSRGANAEVATALALELPVLSLEEALQDEAEPWPPWGRELLESKATASPRAGVLEEARDLITGDRNNSYGPPTQDFQRSADALTAMGYRGPEGRDVRAHDIAIMVTMVKISRLMWTPAKRDSWVDVAGYAACGYECAVETGE